MLFPLSSNCINYPNCVIQSTQPPTWCALKSIHLTFLWFVSVICSTHVYIWIAGFCLLINFPTVFCIVGNKRSQFSPQQGNWRSSRRGWLEGNNSVLTVIIQSWNTRAAGKFFDPQHCVPQWSIACLNLHCAYYLYGNVLALVVCCYFQYHFAFTPWNATPLS